MNMIPFREDMMVKPIQWFIGSTALVAAMGLSWLPYATAQTGQTTFEGRGVASGSAFTRGRNAQVSLLLDRNNNFSLELAEPNASGRQGESSRARIQYRGAVLRQQNSGPSNSHSFTLDTRIRSFDSSANLRIITNTTGTCRIEVFDARVISSTCRAAASDSTSQFLGLEQF